MSFLQDVNEARVSFKLCIFCRNKTKTPFFFTRVLMISDLKHHQADFEAKIHGMK